MAKPALYVQLEEAEGSVSELLIWPSSPPWGRRGGVFHLFLSRFLLSLISLLQASVHLSWYVFVRQTQYRWVMDSCSVCGVSSVCNEPGVVELCPTEPCQAQAGVCSGIVSSSGVAGFLYADLSLWSGVGHGMLYARNQSLHVLGTRLQLIE